MARAIGTIGTIPLIDFSSTTWGGPILTDLTNLKMLANYHTATATKAGFFVNGTQYQVPIGKTLRLLAFRANGYSSLGYASNSGLTTGLVTLLETGFGTVNSGVTSYGAGGIKLNIPATMYPYTVDPTGGSADGNTIVFGYEV